MLDHKRVFAIAKKDTVWLDHLKATDQKMPIGGFFGDSLEMGIWAAGYAGWILGKYGPEEYLRLRDIWRKL